VGEWRLPHDCRVPYGGGRKGWRDAAVLHRLVRVTRPPGTVHPSPLLISMHYRVPQAQQCVARRTRCSEVS
jgi:hypothetical protein